METRSLHILRRVIPAVAVACLACLLCSCGPRIEGYAVMLWGETERYPRTGDIVSVMQQSAITHTCMVIVPGEKKPREYPEGRMRVFRKRGEAADFAKVFAPYRESWAFNRKQDPPPLPIRDEAKSEAKTIYKLRPGQMVKIVSRSAESETIKPYTDYWYEVLTEEGVTGFCFGHFLKTFTAASDPAAEAQRLANKDENLEKIMANTWRPDWFREQIADGAIDLSMLREDVGLFPNAAENTMHLVLPLSTLDFPYTGIERLGTGTYVFTGSDLRISVLDEERIQLTYRFKDQTLTGIYAVMTDDVAEIVEAEQKRQEGLFGALMRAGGTLSSSAYGTIRLEEEMRFSWQGFQKLVPSLIRAGAKGTGRIDFTYHAAKQIQGSYDGVITFEFDDSSGSVSFLYKSTGGGVRFTSLAKDSFEGLFVTHPGLSPVVIFFSQSQ